MRRLPRRRYGLKADFLTFSVTFSFRPRSPEAVFSEHGTTTYENLDSLCHQFAFGLALTVSPLRANSSPTARPGTAINETIRSPAT
jgi:hypothetical protein